MIAISEGLSIFLLFAPNVLTVRGGRRNRKRKNKWDLCKGDKSVILPTLHTGHVKKKKKQQPSIQGNCHKSHIPDYMAVFLTGKPEVVKGGFLACPMLLFMA